MPRVVMATGRVVPGDSPLGPFKFEVLVDFGLSGRRLGELVCGSRATVGFREMLVVEAIGMGETVKEIQVCAMNPYAVLGLSADASVEDVRSAYCHRALELHPDRLGGGVDAFLEAQEAYGWLADPRRRTVLDRVAGCEPLVPSVDPARGLSRDLFEVFQTYGPSLDEVTDRWMANFSAGERPKSEGLVGLQVDVPLSGEQLLQGGEVVLGVPARVPCRACAGEGSVGAYLCWRCGGVGSMLGDMPVRVEHPAGIPDGYRVVVPLETFGITNLCLVVRFRLSDQVAW